MQIISDDIRFVAPAPAGVQNLTATVVGTPGPPAAAANSPQAYWYWVIANYPIGSVVSGPAFVPNAPMPLSAANFVRINWEAAERATSYVVVRSSAPEFPPVPGNVAIAPGATGATTVDDMGGLLVSTDTLPLASGSPAACRVHLNNRDYTSATLYFPCPIHVSKIIFPDGSSQTGASGETADIPAFIAGPGISVITGPNSVTISNLWPQSPWSSDVNANGYSLYNVAQLGVNGSVNIGGCYQIGGVSFACPDGSGGIALSNISSINGSPPGGGGGGGAGTSHMTMHTVADRQIGQGSAPVIEYNNTLGNPMYISVCLVLDTADVVDLWIGETLAAHVDNSNPQEITVQLFGVIPLGWAYGLSSTGATIPNYVTWAEWY